MESECLGLRGYIDFKTMFFNYDKRKMEIYRRRCSMADLCLLVSNKERKIYPTGKGNMKIFFFDNKI